MKKQNGVAICPQPLLVVADDGGGLQPPLPCLAVCVLIRQIARGIWAGMNFKWFKLMISTPGWSSDLAINYLKAYRLPSPTPYIVLSESMLVSLFQNLLLGRKEFI